MARQSIQRMRPEAHWEWPLAATSECAMMTDPTGAIRGGRGQVGARDWASMTREEKLAWARTVVEGSRAADRPVDD
jgi:hypothetical protein